MMKVFNAKAQERQETTWEVDKNGELVCTFEDGHFIKFPGDLTEAQFKRLLETHERVNKGQEIITPEREAEIAKDREKAEKLADKFNGGTPKGDKTNAPTKTPQE